jgi:hypothetical protein
MTFATESDYYGHLKHVAARIREQLRARSATTGSLEAQRAVYRYAGTFTEDLPSVRGIIAHTDHLDAADRMPMAQPAAGVYDVLRTIALHAYAADLMAILDRNVV